MTVVPEHYKDDLARRIFPIRFRHIGNPYAFLNEVGLIPILEYIYKGNLLIDVAEALNVSLTILTRWVEMEGHGQAIEEAEQVSAEGYLAEGHRRLRNASNAFELAKAKEMVKQAQFMASKKDKRRYGTSEMLGGAGGGVSYVFNIGGDVSAPTLRTVENIVEKTLEQDNTPVELDLMAELAQNEPFDQQTPIGAIDWANKPPTKPLVSLKHLNDEPEIGPFFDAPEPTDDV
jgi:hypothetical protein